MDDGSRDGTAEKAEAAGTHGAAQRVQPGKGYAVRRGMLAAQRRHLMTDADLDADPRSWTAWPARMDEGYDVVIGSRALPQSRIEDPPAVVPREHGPLFNLFVRTLGRCRASRDTQCGFKLFRRRRPARCSPRAALDGFSFDVEALFLRRPEGPPHRRAAGRAWRNDAATRVSLGRGFLAFPDLLRIRANAWTGRYQGL